MKASRISDSLGFLRNLKLVYYMKIPPRSFFIAQVVGMVVSSSVSYGVTWWLLSSMENICDLTKLPKGSPWTCPIEHVGNNIIAIWGIVGPPRMFTPYGQYSMLYIFFVVGVLGPLVVWIMTLVFPTKKWIRLINVPYSCSGGRLINVPTILLTATFMAPVLATALDAGTAFMALFISFPLQTEGVYGPSWWGLSLDDHCPLAKCPTAPGIG